MSIPLNDDKDDYDKKRENAIKLQRQDDIDELWVLINQLGRDNITRVIREINTMNQKEGCFRRDVSSIKPILPKQLSLGIRPDNTLEELLRIDEGYAVSIQVYAIDTAVSIQAYAIDQNEPVLDDEVVINHNDMEDERKRKKIMRAITNMLRSYQNVKNKNVTHDEVHEQSHHDKWFIEPEGEINKNIFL